MLIRTIAIASVFVAGLGAANAASIKNPGFEDKYKGWKEAGDKEDSKTSEVAHSGSRSAKMTSSKARFDQEVKVDANSTYVLQAYFAGSGVIGVVINGKELRAEGKGKGKDWYPVQLEFNTGSAKSVSVFGGYTKGEVRYDDFSLTKK